MNHETLCCTEYLSLLYTVSSESGTSLLNATYVDWIIT